ncbi:peptidoglycan DD-metalloendopeptidase family protein [Archaeoglobus sulfaticallidus]|nr:peptidoglycan DD-metalloendopeptidase family protein [Archaeoglobus sulfaticallidus]
MLVAFVLVFLTMPSDAYPVYPNTDSPPVLEFIWNKTNPLNLSTDIYACGPFGIDEGGGFLNQEMAIFFANRSRDPIYAPCNGTVTYFLPWEYFENASEPGKGGEIWIRYGENYAVAYRHIVTVGLNLSEGDIVKQGDVIGYVADWYPEPNFHGGFMEFLVAGRENGSYYYYRPFDFFSNQSKALLLQIWNHSQVKNDFGYNTVTHPWGDVVKFSSTSGDQEIPHKSDFTIKGDFNDNGKVDFEDAMHVAGMVMKKVKPDLSADFNNNGRIDVGDLAKIVYHIMGMAKL